MTGALQMVSSNRLEALVERLAAAMRAERQDPLAAEIVVVQSRGMARWVQLELARLNGVCALTNFPFPKAFIREVCGTVVPEAKDEARFDRDALTWRVWEVLSARRDDPAFAEPTRYARDDPRRRFQLAVRVAGLLDQYLVYRPDWVAAWEAGEGDGWQPLVWRAIRGGPEAWPEPRWLSTTAQRLRDGVPARLPERVSLFAMAALPPAYLDLFAALATRVDVTLYTLQPSPEYWADLVSSREEQRDLQRAGRRADEGAALHLERGPRLLMSLGRHGRNFLRQLVEHGAGDGEDPFMDPGEDTLLHTLQSDILCLRTRSASDAAESRVALRVEDPSIRVHVCHSARRELEVLYDQLLDAMDTDRTLTPRDVLVLTPDIEAYAPVIHAVFGTPEEERLRLPYTIADRVPRAESSLADAFLRLLKLPESRWGRSEIDPLLEVPAVQQRFGFTPDSVVRVRAWLDQLGTSWGLDAGQRHDLGLPELPQGTWRHGADRILLGAAMAAGDETLVGGLSPLDGIEGDRAALAGGVAALVAALEMLGPLGRRELMLSEWAVALGGVFNSFFEAELSEASDERLVRGALARLQATARAAEFDLPVRLVMVREQLELWLGEERQAGGFLRGGITFAALKPMRSIPARIIAVIGLNDGAFPRQQVAPTFDLITADPREGDEARQEDDRHLFLETLLSARDRLHLSYVGQSIRDNAPLPPSAVIGELLDHLEDIAQGQGDEVKHVIVRHPLQAFSGDYFGGRNDPRLFSYSAENQRAALAAIHGPTSVEPQVLETILVSGIGGEALLPCGIEDSPAGRPRSIEAEVELEALLRFLRNPAKFFLRERLGIRLPEPGEIRMDRERFSVEGREKFHWKQQWLQRLRAGEPVEALAARLAADGDLPLGPAGEIAARELDASTAALLNAIPLEQRAELPPVAVEVRVGATRLRGQVAGLTPGGVLWAKPAKFKGADLLDLWVRLLVLAVHGYPQVMTARLIAQNSDDSIEEYGLSVPPCPADCLSDLLNVFADARPRPFPLFPRSATAFTEPTKSKTPPLERALKEWLGNDRVPGECAEPAFALCFGRVMPHPLDAEFEALATRVFAPMWQHARKGPS